MVHSITEEGDFLVGQGLAPDLNRSTIAGPSSRESLNRESREQSASDLLGRGLEHYQGIPTFGVLQHAAEQLPDHPAIEHGSARWNYRDLNADAIRCAAMLQRLGIKAGDRVGILLPNVPEYVIAINGIWRAGGIAVAISPLMVSDEIGGLLAHTKCRLLISLDLLHCILDDLSETQRPETTLLVSLRDKLPAYQQLGYLLKLAYKKWSASGTAKLGAVHDFWTEIHETKVPWIEPCLDPRRDPAFILATGGTTDRPKAVTLSHENMVANAWQQYVWTERSFGTERMLAVLPYFHSYGMSTTLLGSAMMGATSILHHRFNTSQVLRLIESRKPTVMHAVPAMLSAMNAQLQKRPVDLSSLRWVISGGASLDEAVGRTFAEHSGALVVEGYGLSEASPVTHVGHLYREPRYGSIGLPLPETRCRIVSTTRPFHDLPYGEVGELWIRGPQVMLGYWGDSLATRRAIRGGWVSNGDLAVRHQDGYFTIVGRKKDLIITSGYNVQPGDVETVLRECELIQDVAVVGDPDPKRGEVVHAHVVLKAGATWDESRLVAFGRKHLAAHKRPRRYTHCQSDLPRNFLGKVLRRKLRHPEPLPDA
ncbi:MAG: AMP-binding protein [Planctomycetota bacterium]